MVRYLIVILSLLGIGQLNAQDIILKRSGESIYCTIEQVNDFYIHFYEIQDESKSLLYKMDVALVEKIFFGNDAGIDDIERIEILKSVVSARRINLIESNVDGLLNKYFSLHYQHVAQKYAVDFGFKRFEGRNTFDSFFESEEDKGSMLEIGISVPLKQIGADPGLYRGLFLRGFGIYTRGSFRTRNFDFFTREYSQAIFGIQGVFSYQLDNHWFVKFYYGMGGTVETNNFGPRTRQADVSEPEGIQNISGFRVGYIF